MNALFSCFTEAYRVSDGVIAKFKRGYCDNAPEYAQIFEERERYFPHPWVDRVLFAFMDSETHRFIVLGVLVEFELLKYVKSTRSNVSYTSTLSARSLCLEYIEVRSDRFADNKEDTLRLFNEFDSAQIAIWVEIIGSFGEAYNSEYKSISELIQLLSAPPHQNF